MVAGALAVLLTTAVALSISTVALGRKERETDAARRKAESSFRQAQAAVDRYLSEVSENRLLNVPGLQPLRKELLVAARSFYEDFVNERGDDPSVRTDLGAAYVNLARITGETGSRLEAIGFYLKARPLLEAVSRERPGDRRPRASAVIGAGLGRVYVEMGRMADAAEAYREGAGPRTSSSSNTPTRSSTEGSMPRS